MRRLDERFAAAEYLGGFPGVLGALDNCANLIPFRALPTLLLLLASSDARLLWGRLPAGLAIRFLSIPFAAIPLLGP
jgi:hypothetical protein